MPYSPVTGPRLLAREDADRLTLRQALVDDAKARGWSSVHVNFLPESECAAFDRDWLPRFDWQFHWHNHGYRDFGDFLDTLIAKKRKNIRQERVRLARAGWRFERRCGFELGESEIDLIHRCYVRTFTRKGNTPALTRDFFVQICRDLPDRTLAVIARLGDEPLACAFFLQNQKTLWGRYWGSLVDEPGLHFETCYYQGIEHAIENGLDSFEPGAQGEHKIARGFLPVRTHSRHDIVDPSFRRAVADYLAEEALRLDRYREVVLRHSPYAARP